MSAEPAAVDAHPLVAGVLAGEVRAIARAISLIEDRDRDADRLMAGIYGHTGRAMTLGVTGPPGAGKSTFVDRLIAEVRRAGHRVGVIAVDPASPFTGGAILGDRVRMTGLTGDNGVYVRSMSTRGHLGGLAAATESAVDVLDAAGYAVIIVETVGVGQSEIEVAELADTTILVQPPGLGDGVQAVKAGIMEVPALFVVNKADLPGAKQAGQEIRGYLGLVEPKADEWQPPVLMVEATHDFTHGVGVVWEAVQSHWAFLRGGDRLAAVRQLRARKLLWQQAERQLLDALHAAVGDELEAESVAAIAARRQSPGEAAGALIRHWRANQG